LEVEKEEDKKSQSLKK